MSDPHRIASAAPARPPAGIGLSATRREARGGLPPSEGAPEDGRAGHRHSPAHHTHHGGHHAGGAWTRAEAVAVLEGPERRETQDPEALWSRAGLKEGETVVDVGAGTGYFAVPAARRVGASGRVYAVDLSAELVAFLSERRERDALPQLVPVQSTLESIPLESAIADVVLLANVLHDIPRSTLIEAIRLLKPDGHLINVDWKKGPTPAGPPFEIRLAPEEAAGLLEREGLEVTARFDFGPWHYGLLLRRSPRPSVLPGGVAG